MAKLSPTKQALRSLQQLDVLESAFVAVSRVTDEHIQRAALKLGEIKANEKPVGTIHNTAAKKLWVAGQIIGAMALESKARSGMADNDVEESRLHMDYHRLDKLSDVIKELFWLQVRSDLDQLDCDSGNDSVGLRAGWMLVIMSASHGAPEALKRLLDRLGGGEIIGPL